MSTKWCTAAILLYRGAGEDIDLPFNFGNGVVLRQIPSWAIEDSITTTLSSSQRERLEQDARFALCAEYEASSLSESDPNWTGEQKRTKEDRAMELLDLANLAAWLAKPSSLSFELVVTADDWGGTSRYRQWCCVRRLRFLKAYEDVRLNNKDLELAAELHDATVTMQRGGPVWMACRALTEALLHEQWEIRYLLLWVALEALFGPEDAREISHRISQRIAFLLSSERESAKKLFKDVREGYKWRSKVVHGLRLSKLGAAESHKLLLDAEDLVRKSLVGLLLKPPLLAIFANRDGRERYLDNLPFQNIPDSASFEG